MPLCFFFWHLLWRRSSPCSSVTTTSTSARFPSRRRRCARTWWSSAGSPVRWTVTSWRCGEAQVSFHHPPPAVSRDLKIMCPCFNQSERAVGDGERMVEVLQRWWQQKEEVRYLLRHQRAPGRESGKNKNLSVPLTPLACLTCYISISTDSVFCADVMKKRNQVEDPVQSFLDNAVRHTFKIPELYCHTQLNLRGCRFKNDI